MYKSLDTYLSYLRDKIFKLLPMREAYDRGEKNHLQEYIENLCLNFSGAFGCYSELSNSKEVVEAYSNLMSLKDNIDIDFKKWRSIILKSTRLIQVVKTRLEEVGYL